MANIKKQNEAEFKRLYRKDECSWCTKRKPCAELGSACDLITPCAVCDIREDCSSLCDQMKAFFARGADKHDAEHRDLPFNEAEDHYSFQAAQAIAEPEEQVENLREVIQVDDVPWEAIPVRSRQILVDHFCLGKTYEQIDQECGATLGTSYKLIRGSRKITGALDKIRIFFAYRNLFTKYEKIVPRKFKEVLSRYYLEYKDATMIAEELRSQTPTVYGNLQKAKKFLIFAKESI